VGGKFESIANNYSACGIARWNPATQQWASLGDGIGGSYPEVEALALGSSGDVYVGGRFSSVSRFVNALRVARWVPTTQGWFALGAGIDPGNSAWWDQTVSALAVAPDGTLYVGGDFSLAGDALSPYLARWAAPVGPTVTPRVEGSNLSLSWPAANLGWELFVQTNTLGVGGTARWQAVPGSRTSTQWSAPMDPSLGAMFFQLRSP
jgi:hypothetical protein